MIQEESPAKINRFLFITGKRPDGYHELYTLFEKITLCDTLRFTIEESEIPKVEISGPAWFPRLEDNLIYRAAMLFMELSGTPLHLVVEVEKEIPAGGGLGGGSSNAASTLTALNRFMGEPLTMDQLMGAGRALGADVPFFIMPHDAAFGRGTGTELEPASPEPRWYLLVFPEFSISTAWAYSNFELTRQINKTIFEPRELKAGRIWYNDLEKPVCRRFPMIKNIKDRLMSCGAEAAVMSGSGSTVFGVFPSRVSAARAEECMKQMGFRTMLAASAGHAQQEAE